MYTIYLWVSFPLSHPLREASNPDRAHPREIWSLCVKYNRVTIAYMYPLYIWQGNDQHFLHFFSHAVSINPPYTLSELKTVGMLFREKRKKWATFFLNYKKIRFHFISLSPLFAGVPFITFYNVPLPYTHIYFKIPWKHSQQKEKVFFYPKRCINVV